MDLITLYHEELTCDYFDSERKDVFKKFIKEISEKNSDHFTFLSFGDIANLIDKKPNDKETFELINMLESKKINFLERRHVFIDDSGYQEEIQKEELDTVVSTNTFAHPVTGEEITDWKDRIFPFFVLSEKVRGQL